jgi:hypothetical protein
VDQRSGQRRISHLFTGKELDEQTGLYYFGARYYDPRTSVWQSTDPAITDYLPSRKQAPKEFQKLEKKLAGQGGVYNAPNMAMYTYVRNNPLKVVDPDGKSGIAFFARPTGTFRPVVRKGPGRPPMGEQVGRQLGQPPRSQWKPEIRQRPSTNRQDPAAPPDMAAPATGSWTEAIGNLVGRVLGALKDAGILGGAAATLQKGEPAKGNGLVRQKPPSGKGRI